MEEFFYLILVVVWLIISLVKRKSKAAPPPGQQKQQPTSQPREKDLGDLLGEFFGQEQPRPAPEAQPGEAERAAQQMERQREEEVEEYYYEELQTPEYQENQQKFADAEGVTEDIVQAVDEKAASVEDLIRKHASEDARLKAEEEQAYGRQDQQDVPEFDLKTAVVFSEILNRKYT
ncbi:MAG: hypothetical protein R6U64_08000 [Bacteroidales bacterium]